MASNEMKGTVRMIVTLEAIVDEKGRVRLLEDVKLSAPRRVFVTILEESPSCVPETALLTEAVLAEDWNREEEDKAWQHLQPVK